MRQDRESRGIQKELKGKKREDDNENVGGREKKEVINGFFFQKYKIK